MNQYWILVAILLPIIGGAGVCFFPQEKKKEILIYLETVAITTSVIVWVLLLQGTTEVFHVVHFVNNLSISFKIDGMTMVFAGLVSLLWPLAILYASEYMEHEKNQTMFFMFYSMTYGVTLGIAFASDMLSMYFFYELLTLVTVPLVMYTLSREAILASRKYLYYSLGGAAFALMGLVFLIIYGDTCEFVLGGVMNVDTIGDKVPLLLWIYFFAFLGFGVKAAIWPLCEWLPQAGVAPTPVTALLHAVAVVKAGVFAMIRLTYYSFGTEFLRGTWVQYVVMAFAIVTIVYGCSRAVKETHIKRRLAYSTVSNLSYIIFGITIMTPQGLVGALSHLIFHAIMKICLFFCAGAFMHKTGKSHVYEMDGLGRKMPVVFGTFAVAGLGLMGVPGLCGFVSKWNLAQAAVESENILAYVGVAGILISAFLTALYIMNVIMRAFFPSKQTVVLERKTSNEVTSVHEQVAKIKETSPLYEATDPTWKMKLPLVVFSIAVVVLGMYTKPLMTFFEAVAQGIY